MTGLEWLGILYGLQLFYDYFTRRGYRRKRVDQMMRDARRWSNN